MRHALRLFVPVFALLVSAASARAQEPRELERVSVAPGLVMLVGPGGNVGVSLGDDGVFLIDDQFAYQHEKIRAALGGAEVRFLVNTHWHGDHTGGNEAFAKDGALIFAHERVRARMSSEQFMAALKRRVPASPPGALPVVTFSEELTFHWNGDEIAVLHVPNAHTDGDAIVHFRRANAIHAGDTYFASGFPFIDRSSGGSIDGLIAAVERVLVLADAETAILPGHGPLSDRAGLERHARMLRSARERAAAAQASGVALEAWLAERPLADFEERWGGGFVSATDFARGVWASLAESR